MIRTLTVFRAVIFASLAFGLAGHIVDIAIPWLIPEGLLEAYETHGPFQEPIEDTLTTNAMALFALGAFAIGLLGAGVAAAVGLLLLQRWARTLALWVTIIGLGVTPFFGVVLYSSWTMALFDTSTTLWGAMLAMAYFSELKVHFDPPGSPVVPAARPAA